MFKISPPENFSQDGSPRARKASRKLSGRLLGKATRRIRRKLGVAEDVSVREALGAQFARYALDTIKLLDKDTREKIANDLLGNGVHVYQLRTGHNSIDLTDLIEFKGDPTPDAVGEMGFDQANAVSTVADRPTVYDAQTNLGAAGPRALAYVEDFAQEVTRQEAYDNQPLAPVTLTQSNILYMADNTVWAIENAGGADYIFRTTEGAGAANDAIEFGSTSDFTSSANSNTFSNGATFPTIQIGVTAADTIDTSLGDLDLVAFENVLIQAAATGASGQVTIDAAGSNSTIRFTDSYHQQTGTPVVGEAFASVSATDLSASNTLANLPVGVGTAVVNGTAASPEQWTDNGAGVMVANGNNNSANGTIDYATGVVVLNYNPGGADNASTLTANYTGTASSWVNPLDLSTSILEWNNLRSRYGAELSIVDMLAIAYQEITADDSNTLLAQNYTIGGQDGLATNVAGTTLGIGLPGGYTPTNPTDIVDKQYVDGLVGGLTWKDPSDTIDFIGETTPIAIDGGTLPVVDGTSLVVTGTSNPSALDNTAYGGSGTTNVSDGDTIEWDATGGAWVVIVQNTGGAGGGFVPAGTRNTVRDSSGTLPAFGLTNGVDNSKILEWDGLGNSIASNTTKYTPDDGWAFVVRGENSIFENSQYVFDLNGGTAATTGIWVPINVGGSISAGVGLSQTGSTINLGNNGAGTFSGLTIGADTVAVAPGFAIALIGPASIAGRTRSRSSRPPSTTAWRTSRRRSRVTRRSHVLRELTATSATSTASKREPL
jgi:hypothetical protein